MNLSTKVSLKIRNYHIMNSIRNIAISIALALSFSLSAGNKPMNVVFFLVDDLGWRDVACFGSDYHQTPNVDKLAQRGVSFTNGYASCTVCSPTRASIMSGKYPANINCTDWIKGWNYPFAKLAVPEWTMYMSPSEYTLAEAFKDAGYVTGHFGKWHLGEDSIYWPENQGFDVNMGGWSKGAPHRNKALGYNAYFPPYGNPRLADKPTDNYLTERLTDEAVSFIDQNKNKAFFLNFWFYNVHGPRMATKEKVDKYTALLDTTKHQQDPVFAAMVEHMDDGVGRVLDKLEQEGLLDHTIIVFASDNGALSGKHNTNNYPLRYGKGHMYEGGVRVPNIIVTPNMSNGGSVVETPMISMDYYPTLTELAKVKVPKNIKKNFDGVSLVKLLKGKGDIDREAIYWHYPHYHNLGAKPYSAIRMGDWKLIRFLEDDSYELYNLKEDISEANDLLSQYPEKVEEMKTKLFAWYKEVDAQMPSKNENYDSKRERKHK